MCLGSMLQTWMAHKLNFPLPRTEPMILSMSWVKQTGYCELGWLLEKLQTNKAAHLCILNLGSGSISVLHCVIRLHQLQRQLAMEGFVFSSRSEQESFIASVDRLDGRIRLLLHQEGYSDPYAPPGPTEPVETEAARQQRWELEAEATREEVERNFMMANDDRSLAQFAQALRRPSPWLLAAMREEECDPSFLQTLDGAAADGCTSHLATGCTTPPSCEH